MINDYKAMLAFIVNLNEEHKFMESGNAINNLKFNDFDPVYRKKDFAQIKKRVIGLLDMDKTYNRSEKLHYARKRLKERDYLSTLIIDQEQKDFMNQERNPNWKGISSAFLDRVEKDKNQAVDLDAIADIEQQIQMKKQLAATFMKL